MAITASDLLFRLSVTTGSAGNSTTQGNVNNSLGKYMSTAAMSGTTLNNLFDNISGAENAASTVDYRCVFVYNTHATLTYQNAVVYVSSQVAGGASVTIATDNVGISASGASSAQATLIANETTAPTGVSAFSAPTTAGTGLSLGNIGPGQCAAVWVKRTAANTVAVANDGFTLAISGDTEA